MSRYAEYEALGAVGDAYGRWVEANTRLDAAMDVAAGQRAAPPVDALEADFAAGLEVTRAVMAFARACPSSGPHVDDLPNAAFVQALFQAVTPQLQGEIDELVRAWSDWLPAIGRWTPDSSQMPPPRPVSAAHSHVLAAVDAWWEADQDALRGRIVGMLTDAGGENTGTSFTTRGDGELIEQTHIVFRAPATESEPSREPAGRLRRLFGSRRDS
ncbi:hypothetical protein HZU38_30530 (plasmid) [Mycolicibacterium vanbaalenii]|uniref:hypothetical protein n=1 Tax=Mycolicibacterium vanbaalenii TaxID=110539 RepID=UPI001F3B34B4|nr:hypothetical protein [Mycolicibacterium vanbaalenii]UJL32138.1 hypothetical protein HZU38_30530 [Mycolicibacterium vanbaalenii]WND60009.1 hypothetical protein QQA43_30590 [Mycolicibacterium vanbaalenii]